ncbi:MAG: DNA-directed RNA polymerase I [Eubacteriales bacterium]|nr:DNA-directed RNA polymerase I [Eubacteriales bacterium]
MSIFNEKQIESMLSREYTCSQCGEKMEFEDEWEDILVCVHCGHSVDLDHYGFENDEEYEKLYPTREEVLGSEEKEN